MGMWCVSRTICPCGWAWKWKPGRSSAWRSVSGRVSNFLESMGGRDLATPFDQSLLGVCCCPCQSGRDRTRLQGFVDEEDLPGLKYAKAADPEDIFATIT